MSNPINHPCPQCQAKPGAWCTQGKRRRDAGFHKARELAAKGSSVSVQDSTGMFNREKRACHKLK